MALNQVGLERLNTAVTDKIGERKNLVVNGNMKVHQRAQSVTGTGGGYVTADRFLLRESPSTTFNSNVTNGVLTCNSPAASTAFDIRHGIEWDNVFYGKTMTISFNATAGAGSVDLTVEVVDGSIANTTAQIAAHLTGTTTDVQDLVVTPVSGTKYEVTVDIPADADVSFTPDMVRLRFGNASASASQSFALSNVQFEFGSVATEFEYRSFAEELQLCQRYYFKQSANNNEFFRGMGMADTDGNSIELNSPFPVTMRVAPSAIEQTGNASDYKIRRSTSATCTSVPSFGHATKDQLQCRFTKSSHGFGDGSAVRCGSGTAGAFIAVSAEL
tara:strand:+ start:302 stop:1291 length:990 start_codon:yes stop_codon:yes gene_type:complete